MKLPGRSANPGEYRYGFQGQEQDDEVKGTGNSVNYKHRMYDPKIARFLAIDPIYKDYPYYSPYAFSGNRVIDAIELEGLQPGVLFSNPNKAFEDFAVLFNDNSIRDNLEYGIKIYSVVDKNGVKHYSYTIPVKGSGSGSGVNIGSINLPSGTNLEAWGHTHAASTVNAKSFGNTVYDDELFSGKEYSPPMKATASTPAAPAVMPVGDRGVSWSLGVDGYVVTPGAKLLKYSFTGNKLVSPIPSTKTIPKDTGPGTGVKGTAAKSTSTYEIKSGDTLWSIAKRYQTSVKAIKAENKLSSNDIYAGDTLKITN
ncbi:MAG: hypothetical protein CL840_14820 [Crocinitomicaceae bacterium]|nr:hypothetical protein [Crocinitomicaceae bacterium]